MPTPARRAAFRVLDHLEARAATLADLLADSDVEALDTRDRGFLHELVLGTLRHRGVVDHALAALVDRPLEQLDPPVRTALRLGAYQILRLRVPHRAAVDESVELARGAQGRAAGFVNAVLRRLSRQGPPPVPDAGSDPLGWLLTEGSLPRWLAQRWVERWGPERAVARARAFLFPPPVVFRLNPRRPGALERVRSAGLDPQPAIVPDAWRAASSAGAAGLAAQGQIYIQDQGSQLVGRLAASPGWILDACAAPGGKATLAGDLVGEAGTVIAAEASPRRLRTLVALVARWGSPNVRCVGADAVLPPFRRAFDTVLLDAPCTGLGTLGRHPDVRWRVVPEDIARHADRQTALLRRLADLVSVGGRLVYATCSSEPEENEVVVGGFLEARADYHVETPSAPATPFLDGSFVRTWPERDGGDAFFAATLRRGR